MLVGKLTMSMSLLCVLLLLRVIAGLMIMRRLMVMMRGGEVMTSCRVIMSLGRLCGRLCHFNVPPCFPVSRYRVNRRVGR